MGFLGTLSEFIINLITLGQGKALATYIALKLGYENCGCDDRKVRWNNWLLPEHKKKYPL